MRHMLRFKVKLIGIFHRGSYFDPHSVPLLCTEKRSCHTGGGGDDSNVKARILRPSGMIEASIQWPHSNSSNVGRDRAMATGVHRLRSRRRLGSFPPTIVVAPSHMINGPSAVQRIFSTGRTNQLREQFRSPLTLHPAGFPFETFYRCSCVSASLLDCLPTSSARTNLGGSHQQYNSLRPGWIFGGKERDVAWSQRLRGDQSYPLGGSVPVRVVLQRFLELCRRAIAPVGRFHGNLRDRACAGNQRTADFALRADVLPERSRAHSHSERRRHFLQRRRRSCPADVDRGRRNRPRHRERRAAVGGAHWQEFWKRPGSRECLGPLRCRRNHSSAGSSDPADEFTPVWLQSGIREGVNTKPVEERKAHLAGGPQVESFRAECPRALHRTCLPLPTAGVHRSSDASCEW